MFTGTLVALVTPFDDHGIDRESLERLVRYCLEDGIDGFVPCGTTGESPVLSEEEYQVTLETVVQVVAGRKPVIAGCGTNSTEKTVQRALIARQAGVQGLLVVTPYYNRPSQEGLKRHFIEVASRVELPVIMYNVPSRTGCDLRAETVIDLAGRAHIVGIKEATGSLKRLFEIRHGVPEDFCLLSGDDFTALPFVLSGGHGVISVVANVAPGMTAAMIRHAREGKLAEAREVNRTLYPLMTSLFSETNPVPVKMALKLLGIGNGRPRLPLEPLAAGLGDDLHAVMKSTLPALS